MLLKSQRFQLSSGTVSEERLFVEQAHTHAALLWRHWASGKHCTVTVNSYFAGLLT